jgi:predicted ribosome quality control (RQC) complex YloA/Tae2 family protein
MKRTLSRWEYQVLLDEAKQLSGRRMEKIYEIKPALFRLDFSFGYSLMAKLGEYFYITKNPPAAPLKPTEFCMYLRKRIEGKKMLNFEEVGNDRIYRLSVEDGMGLIFEQFGKGNLLLVEKDEKILRSYWPQKESGYSIGQRQQEGQPIQFSLPPKLHEAKKLIEREPEICLLSALSKMHVGKIYAKEILMGSGLEEKKAKDIEEKKLEEILEKLAKLMARISPRVYEDLKGECVELSLVALPSFDKAGYSYKTFQTFSPAAEYYFSKAQDAQKGKEKENPQLDRLKKRLEEQNLGLQRVEKEIESISKEIRYIEENLASLEERRENILNGNIGAEKFDDKKKKWWI